MILVVAARGRPFNSAVNPALFSESELISCLAPMSRPLGLEKNR